MSVYVVDTIHKVYPTRHFECLSTAGAIILTETCSSNFIAKVVAKYSKFNFEAGLVNQGRL